MNRSNINLLDLPDEILLRILKKLNNVDVLYSLIDINNGHLNSLAQEKAFSNTLDFVSIDNGSVIDQEKLDRFCKIILPKIRENVKYVILEPLSMECILLTADYPNLIELKLFNFTEEICLKYFTNESSLRYIFQEKLTHLTLVNIDERPRIKSLKNYNKNVYEHILKFFRNLKYLSFIDAHHRSHPSLSLCDSPSISFSSTNLTYLSINVSTFDDCLYLLDGRFKHLTTLIVQICRTTKSSVISITDNLSNLKCFSLICYHLLNIYDEHILPLLHHMTCLEKLTMHLCIPKRDKFIDNSHLEKEILLYMPHLHSFTFYISTYYDRAADLFRYVPRYDIQQTTVNIEHQQYMVNMINYISFDRAVYSIFSLPFTFHRIQDVGNIFPDIIFKYVTHLVVKDIVLFNHEFFLRISRSFPLLQRLSTINPILQSSSDMNSFLLNDGQSCSIAKYPHLTKLSVGPININNIEEFLNETKTSVPCLISLTTTYNDLRIVTKNFTREETRNNCKDIKELALFNMSPEAKEFYDYFPSLQRKFCFYPLIN